MPCPTDVLPVNVIISTFLLSAKRFPTVLPEPMTRFAVPFGRSHLSSISKSFNAESTVSELGLKIILLPAASAGAIFHTLIKNGKFQGVISAQTPTGSFNVYECILPKLLFTL